MSYSFGEMKKLEREADEWLEKAEEYQTLPVKIGQDYPDVIRYLKSAMDILARGGVWEGPDGEACRNVIRELQENVKKEQALLQEMADQMSEAARKESRKVREKLMFEVYPNMSLQGKIDASADYLADCVVRGIRGK